MDALLIMYKTVGTGFFLVCAYAVLSDLLQNVDTKMLLNVLLCVVVLVASFHAFILVMEDLIKWISS